MKVLCLRSRDYFQFEESIHLRVFVFIVSVLHSGHANDLQFIQKLERNLLNFTGPAFSLEYIDFHESQQKVAVIYLTLKKYKENKLPLIVLLSKNFLELVWPTEFKSYILKDLLHYNCKYYVHIWMSCLTEREMKKHSTGLCRTDGSFRRIMMTDLQGISGYTLVAMIDISLHGNVFCFSINLYSICFTI